MNRGEIQHIARAQQINSFKNLQYEKITPTDIDGVIEYKNKAYIFLEVKYEDKELPSGQRLALERLVKDTATNKKSICIVCEHQIKNTSEQIYVAGCDVREIYLSGEFKWRPPINKITVKELMDLFINNVVERIF